MIKVVWAFLLAMPDMVKLIKELQKRYDEHERQQKLKKDIEEIREAFRTRDADRLKRVFDNSNPGKTTKS